MEQKNEPTKFWVEDPSILFTDMVLFPIEGMTLAQKLNALTRLAIVIAIVMYVMEYKNWHIFLLASILILVVINYSSKSKKESCCGGGNKEGFTLTPTRIGDDFQSTVVAPVFAEETRIPPPAYDLYTKIEYEDMPFEEPIRPQAYPYGQYLTRTNLLPSDEYQVHMNPNGGAKTAREYVNSTFTKNDMAYRENMTRIFKKSLDRRFRHTIQDSWSPFHSY